MRICSLGFGSGLLEADIPRARTAVVTCIADTAISFVRVDLVALQEVVAGQVETFSAGGHYSCCILTGVYCQRLLK